MADRIRTQRSRLVSCVLVRCCTRADLKGSKRKDVAVSHSVIARVWKEHDLQPWRQGISKLPRDPRFAEKVVDIVELYLDPPDGAVLLAGGEKTQV